MGSLDRATALATRLVLAAARPWTPARLPILIFHRVHARPDPLFPQEMDAARFDRLMSLVARSFDVLTLGRAARQLADGRLPARPLVITFDDGYADNAEVALPILKRHGLAATFFVSTGFLDGGRMWNDTVIETLRRTPRERIDLTDFGLGNVALAGAEGRRSAIDALLPRIKYLALAAREVALARLAELAGAADLPNGLMMRSAQVVELQRAGMEIGGHTVNHPILTELADAEAQAEIDGGRAHLQALIDRPVEVFAYPNGGPGRDYDARHVAMVRRLGFSAAVSTAPGMATAQADRLQLPRFTPWDREPHRWAARLVWQRLRGAHYALAGAPA